MVDYIIILIAIAIVFAVGKKIIFNKNGCSGECDDCSGCNVDDGKKK